MRKAVIIIILGLFIAPFNVFAYGTNYRYENKPFDIEANLYDFQARKYNPNIGQFIQSDTYLEELLLKGAGGNDPELQRLLANPQLLNQRSFKNNNPINYTDPTGKIAVPVVPLVDVILDPMFISDSYDNMQTKQSTWSEIKFGADSALLVVPFLPMITTMEKVGEGVKNTSQSFGKLLNSAGEKLGKLFNKVSVKLFNGTALTAEMIEKGNLPKLIQEKLKPIYNFNLVGSKEIFNYNDINIEIKYRETLGADEALSRTVKYRDNSNQFIKGYHEVISTDGKIIHRDELK